MNGRVVFVDDEPAILEGLRDRLWRLRRGWNLVFHASPRDALHDIAENGADVVISDVRMPEIDGAELLGRVRELAPAATRVALTGQADADTALQVHVTAHQFLSKPCDIARIVDVIERRAALGASVPMTALVVAASAPEVPASPRTFRQLDLLFSRESWGLEEASRIIEADAIAATHVVRVASSPYFGGRHVSSVDGAVRLLGARTVQRIVLGLNTAGAFGSSTRDARGQGYSRHASQIAEWASTVAEPARASDAYVAGLLHDVGSLVLSTTHAKSHAMAVERAGVVGIPLEHAERDAFGFDHADVGAALLGIWGLPGDIVEAVLLHHREGGGPIAQWLREAEGRLHAEPPRTTGAER